MKKIITELQKALQDGHSLACEFKDGRICCCLFPETSYSITNVTITPKPCLPTETIVYRFHLPDGRKGFAILDFEQDDQ